MTQQAEIIRPYPGDTPMSSTISDEVTPAMAASFVSKMGGMKARKDESTDDYRLRIANAWGAVMHAARPAVDEGVVDLLVEALQLIAFYSDSEYAVEKAQSALAAAAIEPLKDGDGA